MGQELSAGQVHGAISARSRSFCAAFALGDIRGLVEEFFVPDHLEPVASPPGMAPARGCDAITALFTGLMQFVDSIEVETLDVTAGGGLAHEFGRSVLRFRDGTAKNGRYSCLWADIDGVWRVKIELVAEDGWDD